MKKLYLDSNVFFHFYFDQIDWANFAGDTDVELVVVPEVLREIDSYKDQDRDHRQERARYAVKWLWDHRDQPVRPGVVLRLRTRDPKREEVEALGLVYDTNDDRIITCILQDKDGSDQILVTTDTVLNLKAEAHLVVKRPPEDKKRKDPPNPLEREIRDLKAKLDQRPKLSLSFSDKKSHSKTLLKVLDEFSEEILEGLLSEERDLIDLENRWGVAALLYHKPSENEVARYLAKFEKWVREHHDSIVRNKLSLSVELELWNVGGGTATDIDVELVVQDEVFLVNPTPGTIPEPPERPRAQSIHERLGLDAKPFKVPRFSALRLARDSDGELTSQKSTPHRADLHLKSLKHTSSHRIPVTMWFETRESALSISGFPIKYRIHPAVGEIEDGELHIVLDKIERPLAACEVDRKREPDEADD